MKKEKPEAARPHLLHTGSLPFNLYHTLLSGQTFRWRKDGKGFIGVVSGNMLRLEQRGRHLLWRSFPGKVSSLELRGYLGLNGTYKKALASLQQDRTLAPALQAFAGMRVLRQEPWETLISFIISSNNNIPRIIRCVESLCWTFGREIEGAPGVHSFPRAAALADASPSCLQKVCNLGYRDAYVKAAAQKVARNPTLLSEIALLPYPAARKRIISEFLGVGPKVADCVLLYSMDKYEAFPVDTWIRKAMQSLYFKGRPARDTDIRAFAADRFGPFAGYAQLYLFQYAISGAMSSLPAAFSLP
jgi:N-glycosylase/DNA lyase